MNEELHDNEDDMNDDDRVEMDASSDEDIDTGDMTAREKLRQQLQADVEAFLAAGGKINQVATNVTADPPRKPQSNYGGQPI